MIANAPEAPPPARLLGRAMAIATLVMAVVATGWLAYELWRLLWQPVPQGARDHVQRWWEVQWWFAGDVLYGILGTAVYPPASYLMFWPFMGWLDHTPARWLWALTSLAVLVILVRICVRESLATTRLERAFVACLPLSMYATGATIGNGQVTLHALTSLLAGLLLLRRPKAGWQLDLTAAGLVLFGLIKVTVTAPFFWFVVFVPGRVRPALLVVVGYALLSVGGAAPQKDSTVQLLWKWQEAGLRGVEYAATREASANVHTQIAGAVEEAMKATGNARATGPERRKWEQRKRFWLRVSSLTMLGLLGAWTLWRRRAEPWALLGVSAVVARFWTYHNWYDDLLILLPMIALFRLAKSAAGSWTGTAAGLLVAASVPVMIAPGGLYLLPSPWKELYVVTQILLWIAMAGLLVLSSVRQPDRS